MQHNWSRRGGAPRLAPLLAVLLSAVCLAIPRAAEAIPVFGGNLYYTGGDVTIEVLHSRTVFDEVLQLRSALGVIDIANGSQTGSLQTLTAAQLAGMGIGVGDELQFGIHVNNTGHDFVLGSGDRNADGIAHAYVRSSPANTYYVGFEDLFGGGDRDFNDTIFRFSGGMSTTASQVAVSEAAVSTGAAPEPASLMLLLPGAGLLAFGFRKR